MAFIFSFAFGAAFTLEALRTPWLMVRLAGACYVAVYAWLFWAALAYIRAVNDWWVAIAYVFHLRHADDAGYQADLSRRMNDKEPAHWLTPDEFEKELDKKAGQ